MSRTQIYQCPNCLLGAIWVEQGTKPDELVDCSNCHEYIKLEELLKKKPKSQKK